MDDKHSKFCKDVELITEAVGDVLKIFHDQLSTVEIKVVHSLDRQVNSTAPILVFDKNPEYDYVTEGSDDLICAHRFRVMLRPLYGASVTIFREKLPKGWQPHFVFYCPGKHAEHDPSRAMWGYWRSHWNPLKDDHGRPTTEEVDALLNNLGSSEGSDAEAG